LPPDRSTEMCNAYTAQDFERTRSLLRNDFQPVVEAAFDEIREAQRRMLAAGAAEALLCGSGSCVAALFESREGAEAARARLDAQPFEWAAVTAFSDGA
jgi:4-diphosphocytidyl-2C-methyl-D-erythritol kinase